MKTIEEENKKLREWITMLINASIEADKPLPSSLNETFKKIRNEMVEFYKDALKH